MSQGEDVLRLKVGMKEAAVLEEVKDRKAYKGCDHTGSSSSAKSGVLVLRGPCDRR